MEWSITGGRPVYVQLVEQLELALLNGTFPPGTRVPPVRELAAEAGVNPNTMQRALAQLEQDGLAKADRTAGRLVTQDTAILDAVRRAEAHVVVNQYYHAMAELGYSQQEATAMLKEEHT